VAVWEVRFRRRDRPLEGAVPLAWKALLLLNQRMVVLWGVVS